MTQAKIKHYQRSMKNMLKLQNFYFPWELEREKASFVADYNYKRCHKSLAKVTPTVVYFSRE